MRWIRWGVALAAALLGGAVFFFVRIAPVATGYAAKVACSAHYLSQRPLGHILAHELADYGYVRVVVDGERRRVHGRLLGLAASTAVFRPGLGCTLVHGQSPEQLRKQALVPRTPLDAEFQPFVDAYDPVLTSSLGVDRRAMERALYFAFDEPDPTRPWRTRAVVVLHRGFLVGEGYREGFSSDTPLPGWSMTKSVLPILLGFARTRGEAPSLDARKMLSGWGEDERRAIVPAHLFGMASGLRFEESYGMLADATEMLFMTEDMGRFAAEQPILHTPGTHFSDSSGSSNILSLLLRRALGDAQYHRLPDRLFDRLGLKTAVWELDASGTFVASSYLFASARDWARLGQLLLQDGVWREERLLPEGWVEWMTTSQSASGGTYGRHLWLETHPALPQDAFSFRGYEGQSVTVVPSREAVVVRLGQTPRGGWPRERFLERVLEALPKAPPEETP